MTVPLIAAQRFCAGLVLGAVLGVWYDFLRPLRPRHTTLSDFLFLPAAFWAWLYVMFAVCRADLRISAFAVLSPLITPTISGSRKISSMALPPFLR